MKFKRSASSSEATSTIPPSTGRLSNRDKATWGIRHFAERVNAFNREKDHTPVHLSRTDIILTYLFPLIWGVLIALWIVAREVLDPGVPDGIVLSTATSRTSDVTNADSFNYGGTLAAFDLNFTNIQTNEAVGYTAHFVYDESDICGDILTRGPETGYGLANAADKITRTPTNENGGGGNGGGNGNGGGSGSGDGGGSGSGSGDSNGRGVLEVLDLFVCNPTAVTDSKSLVQNSLWDRARAFVLLETETETEATDLSFALQFLQFPPGADFNPERDTSRLADLGSLFFLPASASATVTLQLTRHLATKGESNRVALSVTVLSMVHHPDMGCRLEDGFAVLSNQDGVPRCVRFLMVPSVFEIQQQAEANTFSAVLNGIAAGGGYVTVIAVVLGAVGYWINRSTRGYRRQQIHGQSPDHLAPYPIHGHSEGDFAEVVHPDMEPYNQQHPPQSWQHPTPNGYPAGATGHEDAFIPPPNMPSVYDQQAQQQASLAQQAGDKHLDTSRGIDSRTETATDLNSTQRPSTTSHSSFAGPQPRGDTYFGAGDEATESRRDSNASVGMTSPTDVLRETYQSDGNYDTIQRVASTSAPVEEARESEASNAHLLPK
eukprot:Clim_evm8s20 gene=Clim_evmTU8s20